MQLLSIVNFTIGSSLQHHLLYYIDSLMYCRTVSVHVCPLFEYLKSRHFVRFTCCYWSFVYYRAARLILVIFSHFTSLMLLLRMLLIGINPNRALLVGFDFACTTSLEMEVSEKEGKWDRSHFIFLSSPFSIFLPLPSQYRGRPVPFVIPLQDWLTKQ